MKGNPHLAGLAVLFVVAVTPALGATPASITGVVRDSAGVPQIAAEVELLRPDMSVVATVYTDGAGRFLISSLEPGRYALKAMGPYFLPTLRENVRVRGSVVVNLTLNTLYEVIQWLPTQPRAGDSQKDDWAWTLRSAANRPLLRWLENGPLVVVSDGPGTQPKLKARLMATGQAGTFGETGERFSTTVEDTPANSQELLARVDFAPGSDAGMESMLGFRQDLGMAGSVQSVAAISIEPEVDGAGDQGLDEAAVRTSEVMRFGPDLQAEVGSTAVAGRFGGDSPHMATAMLPFASIELRGSASTLHYRMTTMAANPANGEDESGAALWLPAIAERNGRLVIEHGMHQEIGWARETDASAVALAVYSDSIANPVLEAMGHFTGSDSAAAGFMLIDSASHLLRAAGPGFSTTGVQASYQHRFGGDNRIRLSYASGSALSMPKLPQPAPLADVLANAHPRHVQSYSISLSGTLDGTQTRWRASYRWQPEDTVTEVARFAKDADDPFLNVRLSQPIHLVRDGSGGLEAMLEVRNLLAEGYRPYILNDGSLLLFATDQRSLQAGLAFTF
ncbi:MAG: carboxypeptidase-like regulatory domain-containing protein [Terracidiphilus sp.]